MEQLSMIRKMGDQTQLLVYIQPSASRSEVTGLFGDPARLKLKIKAPPRDGEANDEVVSFVAKLLGISRSRVGIIRGESSRQKDLLIDLPSEKVIISLKEILRLTKSEM